jgi:ABC-type multidrug transport system ATPase subunit
MLKKKVKTLSGGQRRRLSFLVSLMGNTKVVLVDEAMTGVDVETRQIMWNILQDEVRLRNRSVVVTSHDMSEVEQYCNTVGILHNGTLIEMGR